MWIKKLWSKLFRRSVKFSIEETNIGIAQNILKLAHKGRINIYNGTVHGLRQAQSDNRSTIFIVEITYPVDKALKIKFKEYVNNLRKHVSVK